jgi:hypothetical protein
VHEQGSCSAPSTLHQFCTPWQQLTPTTWHAGGQLSRRPIRWLAEEQSRLLNRRLCASAVGPDHLLASGTKDQAVWALATSPKRLVLIAHSIRPRSRRPQGIFNRTDTINKQEPSRICAHAEVREPSALLTPDQRFLRATFTCGQSTPSRKEARLLLASDSEPSEWCGAALYVS